MVLIPGEGSRLALGTVKLGRNTDVKYPGSFELPSDEEVTVLLETARELGINILDTAPAYGTSESRLGELLPGRREDWVICTKAGENHDDAGSHYDFSGDGITRSIHRSLKRLRTDYLDIVLVHSDGSDLAIIENSGAIDALQGLKDEGIIRAIGISTKTVDGGLAALPLVDVLMVTLNLDDRSQLPVIEAAAEQDVAVLLKKVFSSGHRDPAESLSYVLGVQGVSAAVVGTINPDHLRENARVAREAAGA